MENKMNRQINKTADKLKAVFLPSQTKKGKNGYMFNQKSKDEQVRDKM
jgi:hypothetical protein